MYETLSDYLSDIYIYIYNVLRVLQATDEPARSGAVVTDARIRELVHGAGSKLRERETSVRNT